MSKDVKYTQWGKEYSCKVCTHILTKQQVYYNHAVCPYCGDRNGATILNCDEISMRLKITENGKWWQFWIRPTIEKEYARC
jgi:hypothetical protein